MSNDESRGILSVRLLGAGRHRFFPLLPVLAGILGVAHLVGVFQSDPVNAALTRLTRLQREHNQAESSEQRSLLVEQGMADMMTLLRELHDCDGETIWSDGKWAGSGDEVSQVIERDAHGDDCPYRLALEEAGIR